MANYTIQLRHMLEKMAGYRTSPTSYTNVAGVLDKTWDIVFGSYPIFDESYRKGLNQKILLHFYQQEIGFETEGQFLLMLNMKMNEIMPYYNKLYLTEKIEFDPFSYVNYVEKYQSQGGYMKEFTHGHQVKSDGTGSTTYGKINDGTNSTEITYGKHVEGADTNDRSGNNSDSGNNTDKSTGTVTTELVHGLKTKTDYGKTSTGTGKDTTNNTYGKTKDTTTNSTTNVSETDNLDATKNSTNKYLDTPEGTLSNINNNTYLTDVRMIDDIDNSVNVKDGETKIKGTVKDVDGGTDKSVTDRTNSVQDSGSDTVSNTGTDKTTVTNDTALNNTHSNSGTFSENSHGTNVTQESGKDTTKTTTKFTDSGTDTNKNSNTTVNSGTDNDSGTDHNAYIREISGNMSADPLDILEKLRKSFLNIDMMIIRELDSLFMQIW